MCSGPSVSQSLTPSMLAVTCSANAGAPSMNWLTTNVRMPPTTAMPLEQDQRHGAAARRAAAVQEVDGGQQQRGQHRRQRDGHHDQLELA